MNKDGDPRRRTPERRGRGTGDPRNRRPSRERRQGREDGDKLTPSQLRALKLKARGHTDKKIAEILTVEESHTEPLDIKGVTTRLQYAYAKLGVSSNTEAVVKAMATGLIIPAFVLEGHDHFDKLPELPDVYRDLAIPLLELLIAEEGRPKTYEELGATPPFRNVKQVRRLGDSIKGILDTNDIYHTTMVYAAWKRKQTEGKQQETAPKPRPRKTTRNRREVMSPIPNNRERWLKDEVFSDQQSALLNFLAQGLTIEQVGTKLSMPYDKMLTTLSQIDTLLRIGRPNPNADLNVVRVLTALARGEINVETKTVGPLKIPQILKTFNRDNFIYVSDYELQLADALIASNGMQSSDHQLARTMKKSERDIQRILSGIYERRSNPTKIKNKTHLAVGWYLFRNGRIPRQMDLIR